MNNKKKNGFTLIELLAVIIILGILMIIAIPSVTRYISDSRKSAYVDTAKEIIGSARNLVNAGKQEMYDTDATYYIDIKCVKTENAMKSPYGDFVDLGAYVVVTYDGKGYSYYWTSVDDAGQGVKGIVSYDKLDADSIESDLTVNDIKTNRSLDGRKKVILITDRNNCQKEGAITENLEQVSSGGSSSGGGSSSNAVVYPTGKTKDTVVVGDIVTIDTEEFYVIKHDGSDLVLLSHYNLKVGNIYNSSYSKTGEYTSSDSGYGIQSSDAKGMVSVASYFNGTVAFSSTNYWNGKVGEGLDYSGDYCTSSSETNCVYVYDANSNLKTYVDSYKTYLEGKGATIKSARLMTLEESYAFSNENQAAWKETSYWLGSAYNYFRVWGVNSDGYFFRNGNYYGDHNFGVRPVIII